MKQLRVLSRAFSHRPFSKQIFSSKGYPQDELFIEDGWIFREHHGKHVECVCRSEKIDDFSAIS